MRVAYSKADMAEAVALAAVVGADAAAEQLGMDPPSVRKWAAKAGHGPEMAVEPDGWRALMDLALSQVTGLVAAGKLRDRDVAVIAGIASRNAAKPISRPDVTAVQAREAFARWLVERTVQGAVDPEAYLAAIDELTLELLRCANAEHGQPHRPALLAWFSDRADVPAGDVLKWAQTQTDALLAEHGSLEGVAVAIEARREAERVAWQAPIAINRDRAGELRLVAIESRSMP